MGVLAVIPARYASTRFPGKPLAPILGKPMIQHVWERVTQVPSIEKVLVATDDERIAAAVQAFGGEVALTSADHETGTDRIVEAVADQPHDWVLNVQGDEPTLRGEDLEQLIQAATARPELPVATLMFRITDPEQLHDPNIVKVTVAANGQALYFSRSLIPYPRQPPEGRPVAWRHLGVYLFRRNFLLEYSRWPRTPLEQCEQLEQLRILENGHAILCVEAQADGVGVDVPEDILRVENLLKTGH